MKMMTMEQSQKVNIQLPYKPTGWQRRVMKDRHQFIVVVAGARSGKTILALTQLVIKAAMKPNSMNWYVAPTYGMAKQIAWEELKRILDSFWEWGLVYKINDSELLINFANNSTIQLKSADNPDSLRGVGLDFLVLDEYAMMKKEVWNEVLRPRVVDKNGEALFTGTPKGYNHFYDLYQMELKESGYWKSYHFKTTDNPYVSKHEVKKAKKDMDERAFKQEFEASFETFGGQVFSDFDRKRHASKKFKFDNNLEFYLGMDFGWSSPTAILFIQVNADEDVFIFDEIKAVQTPISEIAKAIRDKNYEHLHYVNMGDISSFEERRKALEPTIDPSIIYCDPAGESRSEAIGTSSVAELRKMGFYVKYKKNYPGIIQEGLNLIRKWLQNGKLFIHPKCINLIQALEMYRYPEPKGDIQSELPLKDGISDHWVDSLRYAFINQFSLKRSIISVL